MDATSRRPQLPALSYLDIGKVKHEEEAYQRHKTSTPQSLSTSAATSPTFRHPSGPPPPYSFTHSASQGNPPANTWSASQSGARTPTEHGRISGDEKDGVKQTARQSLPSISEALGTDSSAPFASSTAPPQSLPPPHLPRSASTVPSSPSPAARRSYPMEPPPALTSSYPSPASHTSFSQFRQDHPQPPAYPPIQDAESTTQPQNPHAHASTGQAPFSRPQESSSTYEQSSSQSAGSMGPPSYPYGYTPYPPRYVDPTPSTSGPIYQPSTVYGAPQSQPNWKSEDSRYGDRQAAHSESVKRHLDFYDLEQALNEVAKTSSMLTDFSRRYGDQMHQNQRAGLSLSHLPGIVEVDDMMHKSQVQLDSLAKIREVIITQQAAYEQHAADQRQQAKAFTAASSVPPEHPPEAEDSKGGFAGSDTKKRRGRAAPPGRCHSCNRAETPEWRRGPDGARTLCNACGLHYAKLTRKNNTANKGAAVGSSNLRPKEQ